MTMSDIACPNCGHGALKIATRCPHCGHPFDAELLQHPEPGDLRRRVPRWLVATTVLTGILALVVVRREQGIRARPDPVPDVTESVVANAPVTAPPPAESLPSQQVEAPVDSTPPAKTAPSTPDTATGTVQSSPLPPQVSAELRFATTWVNVRAGRDLTAPVVLVLKPSDSVRVDSLGHGWYRVVQDDRTVGYVDRNLVGAERPSAQP